MKKNIFFLIIVSFLLSACNVPDNHSQTISQSSHEETKIEIVDGKNDKSNSQPIITIDDHVTEENDDFQSSTTNSDWNLTLVNKWNPLPDNYAITLVEVPGGEKVDERIYGPLMEMLEAAKEANWDQLPKVVSGYRTQETQQKLYDDKIAEYKQQGYSENEAVEQTEQWFAVPGYSEHQLGIAVDINGATYDLYFWLQENSYKYGFIFRYPAGKTDITGTAEEVWHYRYVGVEAATEMYEQGLCLEEYLDKIEKNRVICRTTAKEKSRRAAAILTCPFETAALKIKAAVSLCPLQINDDL